MTYKKVTIILRYNLLYLFVNQAPGSSPHYSSKTHFIVTKTNLWSVVTSFLVYVVLNEFGNLLWFCQFCNGD